jgi:hypothetical protein
VQSPTSAGRASKGVPQSRAEVLATLLRKRAAAWQGGLIDLESQLRSQIHWALPIENPAEVSTAPPSNEDET